MIRVSPSKIKLLITTGLLFWLPLILFSTIANEVTERVPLPGDVAILEFIHAHFPAELTSVFLAVTNAGSALSIVAITCILTAIFFRKNMHQRALILLVSVGGAAAANIIIKLLFKRQRPSLWHSVIQEQSFSFPSGHAMASSALVFALIYIFWKTRFRWLVIVAGILFMILVGLSRLYFGVHYPSDVFAGWLVSFIWVSLVVAILTRQSFTDYFSTFTLRKPDLHSSNDQD